VAGSLLTAIGLPELITTSRAAYETLALELAQNPQRLAGVRDKLESNRATAALFDMPAYAHRLETAYATMWETWRAGKPPAGFSVD
jgi:predicted O-linked N-acetylglucosamine transferase (SPINDLY family)